MIININNFDFELPIELIAQKPIKPRDKARLMVINDINIKHMFFNEIVELFDKDDLIIFNNSRVIPSRMYGKKKTGGKIEILFLRDMSNEFKDENIWLVILKGHGLRTGVKLYFGDKRSLLEGEIVKWVENGKFLVKFKFNNGNIRDFINKKAIIALPPYIKRKYKKFNMYQTVYSKQDGSIAAPTAGLHFTEKLLIKLRRNGVKIGFLTLHVSASSFIPITEQTITKPPIDPEYYYIPKETIDLYNKFTERNAHITVVGTTTLKALESACNDDGKITNPEGMSNLFIFPGYKFRSKVSKFITNFHTPKSPPLLMVSAFYDWEKLKKAYQIAIENKYRFYSFGDGMLIYKNPLK
ncbi:MAG: tRNA preQ1(34) S-adenosylmethionine ribosyltransferase-isomerase QueA [Candidatus Helarchaeota archaeon]